MGDTKIEWTNKTWNPIRARNKATGKVGWFCEHVSEGCKRCNLSGSCYCGCKPCQEARKKAREQKK